MSHDCKAEFVDYNGSEIAVVGAVCRFPGARDIGTFWKNLQAGVCSTRRFTDSELRQANVSRDLLQRPDYVPYGGTVDDVELFDAEFFGITRREAEILDVQQRLFLECVWELLESAGYDCERYGASIGVFAGAAMSSYLYGVLARPDIVAAIGEFQVRHGNDKDFVATRVSYKLNLGGPSLTVQTSCSTGLVAAHLASQSLLAGECDLAVVGATSIRVPQFAGYIYEPKGILSPDGMCRAFDSAAGGTVFTNGVGVTALKRLEDALRDRDTIWAVIRGTAVNNDGARKVGFTAPSVEGQAGVLEEALAVAQVDPSSVTCIEAHGTGTQLGDPVEMAAIRKVYGAKDGPPCAIGSVKTNIGHLGTAAGIAGLIKAALMLRHGQMVPSLHFERPNPGLELEGSRFFINTSAQRFDRPQGPRRLGLSSFGMGGTNAHAILEEPPPVSPRTFVVMPRAFLVSARTPDALARAQAALCNHLEQSTGEELADVAFTTQIGRKNFPKRYVAIAETRAEATTILRRPVSEDNVRDRQIPAASELVFLFSGQTFQQLGPGGAFCASIPLFKEEFDKCALEISHQLGRDEKVFEEGDSRLHNVNGEHRQVEHSQSELFTLEYALARVLVRLGLRPSAVVGYSLGELTAACIAGVVSLEEAAHLVVSRENLTRRSPKGLMLSIQADPQSITPLLGDNLCIAAINGPENITVSGLVAAITNLERSLSERGVVCRQLKTSYAFHSGLMDPVISEFELEVARAHLVAPKCRMLSNVTGNWLTNDEATSPALWASQLRRPVQFAACARELLSAGFRRFIQIGPGHNLTSAVLALAGEVGPILAVPTLDDEQAHGGIGGLLKALSELWVSGTAVDWPLLWQYDMVRRIPLPTYPFQRQRYWLAPVGPLNTGTDGTAVAERQTTDRAIEIVEIAAEAKITPLTAETVPQGYVSPRNAIEELIVEIWRELLGTLQIGVETSFFDLGGNSLTAVRLVSRLRETFKVELPIRELFEATTVAELAELVGQSLLDDGIHDAV